ncbi:MAG TPA: hypothetical protein PLG94_13420 [Smithellaceae bacterium]|nr:hypothetical protein [Smithellaceae bacterium]
MNQKNEIEGSQAPEHRQDGQGQPQEDQTLRDGVNGRTHAPGKC